MTLLLPSRSDEGPSQEEATCNSEEADPDSRDNGESQEVKCELANP